MKKFKFEENIFVNREDRSNYLFIFLLAMIFPVLLVGGELMMTLLIVCASIFFLVTINNNENIINVYEFIAWIIYISLIIFNLKVLFLLYTLLLLIIIIVNNRNVVYKIEYVKDDFLYDLTEQEAASIKSLMLLREKGAINCDVPKPLRKAVKIPYEVDTEPLWFNPFHKKFIIKKHHSIGRLTVDNDNELLYGNVIEKHLKDFDVELLQRIYGSHSVEKPKEEPRRTIVSQVYDMDISLDIDADDIL